MNRPCPPPQICLQKAAFAELLEGLHHLKRLGTRGSAQAGLGYRKTMMQVCLASLRGWEGRGGEGGERGDGEERAEKGARC